jgi:hypothetical protein
LGFAPGTRPANQLASGEDALAHNRDQAPRSADKRNSFDVLADNLKIFSTYSDLIVLSAT